VRAEALYRFDHQLKKTYKILSHRSPCLVGIDEAGRGPLAGPVVACAIILPKGFTDPRLNDSKKIPPKPREDLYQRLKNESRWAFGLGSVSLIDTVNILRATHSAMHEALKNLLKRYPDLRAGLVAVDGMPIPPTGSTQVSIIKGDCQSASIAAASVMAKVFRDIIMRTLCTRYPGYAFSKHKGYATSEHQEKLAVLGPSAVHRRSFYPVSQRFSEN